MSARRPRPENKCATNAPRSENWSHEPKKIRNAQRTLVRRLDWAPRLSAPEAARPRQFCSPGIAAKAASNGYKRGREQLNTADEPPHCQALGHTSSRAVHFHGESLSFARRGEKIKIRSPRALPGWEWHSTAIDAAAGTIIFRLLPLRCAAATSPHITSHRVTSAQLSSEQLRSAARKSHHSQVKCAAPRHGLHLWCHPLAIISFNNATYV